MPKMKSKSGAKKRFSFTGSGRIKHAKANHSHILTKKSPKRKRRLRGESLIAMVDHKNVVALLPYGA